MWISYLDFNCKTDESKMTYGKKLSHDREDCGDHVQGMTQEAVQSPGERGYSILGFRVANQEVPGQYKRCLKQALGLGRRNCRLGR